jgi:hypothetical protein
MQLTFVSAALTLLALAGCGNQTVSLAIPTPSASCASGMAIVGVHDSFLQVLCGCSEAAGTAATPPAALTCTVSSGTVVVFQYLGSSARRQIRSTAAATLTFAGSPVVDPREATSPRAHAVQLTTSGTYPFEDSLDASLNGSIVVL